MPNTAGNASRWVTVIPVTYGENMDKKLFQIASRVATPLSLASTVVIVLYLVYRNILSLGVFSALAESNTFNLLNSIVDKLFYLSLVALILGVAAYVYVQRLRSQ